MQVKDRQGTDSGGDGQGQDRQDQVFSDAQKQEMIRLSNAANSAHHSRLQKVVDQKLSEMGTTITAKMEEMITQLKPAGDTGTPGKTEKNGKESDEIATLRAEYEARFAENENQLKAERDARSQEATRNRINTERSKLSTALGLAGVDAGRIRPAVALLHTEDKRVSLSDTGEVVFKIQKDGYTDDLPLDEGIEEWLKSPEGKHFAPSRDVHGSGATGGRAPSRPGEKKTKREMKHDLVRAILQS